MGIQGLDYQLVDVKFTQGLDTRTDQKLVVPGKWLALNNLTLSSNDALTRRDGMTALVSSANGNGLALYNDELLTVQNNVVRSVSLSGTRTANAVAGVPGWVSVSKTEVERSLGFQRNPDVAYGSFVTAYVWENINAAGTAVTGLSITVVDDATGAKFYSERALAVGPLPHNPRVVYSGGTFYFLWYDTSGGITCIRCQPMSFVAGVPVLSAVATVIITDASLVPNYFDACDFGGTGALVSVIYADGVTSVVSFRVTLVAGVPTLSGSVACVSEVFLPNATITAITCAQFASGTLAGIFLASSTLNKGIVGAVINQASALTTGATALDTNTGPAAGAVMCHITAAPPGSSTTSLQVFADRYSVYGTASFQPIRTVIVNTTLGITTAAFTLANSASFRVNAAEPSGPQGPWICGKAFSDGNISTLLPVCIAENWAGLGANTANNNQQNAVFLLDGFQLSTIVAKALYGTYGFPGTPGGNPGSGAPSSSPLIPSRGYSFAATERTTLSFANGINVSPSGLCRLSFSPRSTTPPLKAQLGTSTYMSGGSLTSYDGMYVGEHGFNLFPEGISVVYSAAAGLNTIGIHQVVAVYEWVDGAGQRHQSAPSPAVTFNALAANTTATAIIPSLLLTQRAGISIVLYMTQAGGLTFYRVNSLVAPILNSTAASSVTATISIADTTLAANEVLYSQPNVAGTTLPNNAPGPCNVVALHQNRLWLDVADTPNAFRYSQQLASNVGLQFNETLGGVIDVNAGGIVGFSELDEKLIIFAARRIYAIFGTGPTSTGGYSNYSDPTEIQSDVGCVEARSILKMPNGIIFKAKKGWHLLGRDLQVRYIGEGVKAYDANSVSAAVLLDDRKECRFASTSGTQLIYSYLSEPGQWSTATMSGHTYAVSDAVWWPLLGSYVHISQTDGLNFDTPGVYVDSPGAVAATQIVTTAKTAFLHLPALEGFQRVRRLYYTATPSNSAAAVNTTLSVAVDFDDTFAATLPPGSLGAYSFSAALSGPTQTPTGSTVDIRHRLARQKCKSVAFTFTDTPAAVSGNGVNPSALAIEVGVKRSANRLPAGQTVG